MNILEQEDLIKGLPDQSLFQQADNPTGDIPQFLIISEIQRRTDMRKRFEAAEPQPQTTAAERIVSEGLGAAMAPQNSLPPPAMPAPPSNPVSQMDGSSPLMAQGMAAGGILGFSNGGGTSTIRDLATKMFGYTPISERTSQYYADQEQHNKLMGRVEEIEKNLMGSIRDKRARRQEALRIAREEQAAEAPVETPVDDPAFYEENPATAGYFPQEKEVISESYLESLPAGLVDNTSSVDKINEYTGEAGYGGQGRENFGITTDEMVYGDQLINPTANETVASQAGTVLPENLFANLPAKETITPTSTADAEDYLAALEQSRQGTLDRLDSRRSESQELINQIREEGKRDALSAALIQLGAGISSGDMSSGLSQAGSAMTSANALARDAARAEQRGMRDYEEAALSGIDQSAVAEKRFQYDQALAQDAINREQSNLDREYGLSTLTAQQNTLLKLSELDQDAQQFIATNELGRDKLEATLDDIERQYTKEEGIDTRAAVQTFIDHMEQVADYLEDQGARMSVEDKQQYLQAERAKILGALQGRIPDAFNVFRSAINSATTSPSGASLTDFDLETLE